MNFANMTSAHFIFIPTVLFVGICIGWVLGSRAARDAYAMAQHKKGSRLRAQGAGGSGLKAQGSGKSGEPPALGE